METFDFMELLNKAYDNFRKYKGDIHYNILGICFSLEDFIISGVIDIDADAIYFDADFRYYDWDDILRYTGNGSYLKYVNIYIDKGFKCYLVGADDFCYSEDGDFLFIFKDATILEKVF